MHEHRRIWLGAALLFAAGVSARSASAQSFDCTKATTTIERLVCANKQLAELDVSLATALSKALDMYPARRHELLAHERAWIAERDARCSVQWTGDPMAMSLCVADRYRAQIAHLEGLTHSQTAGVPTPETSSGEEKAQSTSWFQPSLTTSNDPICPVFLSGARTDNMTYRGLMRISDQLDQLTLERRGAKPLYVERITNPGCGGACESQSLGLLATAPSLDATVIQDPIDETPPAEAWGIYQAHSGGPYAAAIVNHQLDVYAGNAASSKWQLACRVQLEPDLDHSQDPHVQQAVASVHALRDAAENMARDEGYGMCGTMHTASRWRTDFEHALGQVLFDPSATALPKWDPPSDNSYGDYARIYSALEVWSLGGLFEHRALQRYNKQLGDTTAVVSDFYQYGFHWTAPRSVDVAQQSIRDAISRLFGFYMYDPYQVPGERRLRGALLTHQPIATIQADAVDLKAMDRAVADSILNVAIEYPEALAYLLSQGADPNHPNAFGKTPLMYAAQYDQLPAVQILVRAGANPNAATTAAPNDCSYAIKKYNVTPLHYAAKYATRQVVQVLLDAGANKYARTTTPYVDPAQGGYPLDWLHDGNPKLSADDLRTLETQLRVTDPRSP